MDGKAFYDRVNDHADLEGLGVETEEGQNVVYVLHKPSGSKYRLTLDSVAEEPWEVLEAILTGKREPQVLEHMTRVVGYYSKVRNWNVSKRGELKDRQAGQYGLSSTVNL